MPCQFMAPMASAPSKLVLAVSLCLPVSLDFGTSICHATLKIFSNGAKKIYLFCLFSLFLVVRMVWWFLAHGRPGTRSFLNVFWAGSWRTRMISPKVLVIGCMGPSRPVLLCFSSYSWGIYLLKSYLMDMLCFDHRTIHSFILPFITALFFQL